ncbi:hypothetical protein PAXRUDRAFT_30156 [Paxillus rubicundulus Ve08.2h10]|uniref:Unplaced genomic scaffold scaffold_23, whole genome shotgun sequence n=1 Tax=Paxillus rubicundulus Ve08.2h10 TaxID=930991 RepID=A0A0D0E5M0_9AGAM|nr:hypothetical protein PAXRUDRAFT_30156 [Paxillus rubicundulus Ve08.2h10]
MSTNIILPTLSAWAVSHLTGLLESTTQVAFGAAFDATFASNCNVTVNGNQLSREQYKTQLLEQSGASPVERSASVNVQGQLEVAGDQGQLSGLVGLFYTSLTDSKFLVLGAPAESKVTSSLNITIQPTEKNPQNPNLPIHGYFDPRRVVTVDQVIAETTFHVTIPAASVIKTRSTNPSSPEVELSPTPSTFVANQGPFGGSFGPGPVRLPQQSPFGGPGSVRLPPSETGAAPETLPGNGEFGVGPVVIPGETVGEDKKA